MSEKIERPAEQEVKKFRGTGIIYLPQNAFEFVPFFQKDYSECSTQCF